MDTCPPPPQVAVETIAMGCEEEEEGEESEDDEWSDDEELDDFDDDDDGHDEEDADHKNKNSTKKSAKRQWSRRRPRPRRKRSPAAAAATVTMRHPASGIVFTWRTAGVKDTTGTELHEGASYRLVATVKDVGPGAPGGAGAVGVTRCRLTLVTPGSGGGR